jgi:hypothetical protein
MSIVRVVAIVFGLAFCCQVLSKGYEDEFDTLWESLWSQGGSPQ